MKKEDNLTQTLSNKYNAAREEERQNLVQVNENWDSDRRSAHIMASNAHSEKKDEQKPFYFLDSEGATADKLLGITDTQKSCHCIKLLTPCEHLPESEVNNASFIHIDEKNIGQLHIFTDQLPIFTVLISNILRAIKIRCTLDSCPDMPELKGLPLQYLVVQCPSPATYPKEQLYMKQEVYPGSAGHLNSLISLKGASVAEKLSKFEANFPQKAKKRKKNWETEFFSNDAVDLLYLANYHLNCVEYMDSKQGKQTKHSVSENNFFSPGKYYRGACYSSGELVIDSSKHFPTGTLIVKLDERKISTPRRDFSKRQLVEEADSLPGSRLLPEEPKDLMKSRYRLLEIANKIDFEPENVILRRAAHLYLRYLVSSHRALLKLDAALLGLGLMLQSYSRTESNNSSPAEDWSDYTVSQYDSDEQEIASTDNSALVFNGELPGSETTSVTAIPVQCTADLNEIPVVQQDYQMTEERPQTNEGPEYIHTRPLLQESQGLKIESLHSSETRTSHPWEESGSLDSEDRALSTPVRAEESIPSASSSPGAYSVQCTDWSNSQSDQTAPRFSEPRSLPRLVLGSVFEIGSLPLWGTQRNVTGLTQASNSLVPVVAHAANSRPSWASQTARIELSQSANRALAVLENRRATFERDWPSGNGISAADAALAGFYRFGPRPRRRVRCFYCGLELDLSHDGCNVWDEHVRYRPACAYLVAVMGGRLCPENAENSH